MKSYYMSKNQNKVKKSHKKSSHKKVKTSKESQKLIEKVKKATKKSKSNKNQKEEKSCAENFQEITSPWACREERATFRFPSKKRRLRGPMKLLRAYLFSRSLSFLLTVQRCYVFLCKCQSSCLYITIKYNFPFQGGIFQRIFWYSPPVQGRLASENHWSVVWNFKAVGSVSLTHTFL